MVTDSQKELIAQAVAQGASSVDLAAKFDYTPAGFRNLLSSPEMRDRIREFQKRIEGQAIAARLKLLLHAGSIYDRAISIALDDGHREQPPMIRFLIDRLWPQKTLIESHSTHALDPDTTKDLAKIVTDLEHLRLATGAIPVERPRLLSGEEAMPKSEPDPRRQ